MFYSCVLCQVHTEDTHILNKDPTGINASMCSLSMQKIYKNYICSTINSACWVDRLANVKKTKRRKKNCKNKVKCVTLFTQTRLVGESNQGSEAQPVERWESPERTKFLISPLQNLPINAAYSSSSMKQLVSVNTWLRVSAAAVFNQCNANSDSCGHWRTVLFLDAAAAEHLEENCMACPGWLARHDYSAPWSSARCSSTLTQVCLEYPAAGAVLRLRPEYRLCPGVGRDTKAPPALWTFSLRLERFLSSMQ